MACPICSKPGEKPFSPFCSKRCADVDLSRWLKGSYAIPGSGAGQEDEEGFGEPNPLENNPLGPDAKGMDRE
jgi:endogenous inhibitor of DNA gyrase (YacG/DUF329 family)